jgi:epsin
MAFAYSFLIILPAASNLIDLTVDESQPWQLQPQFTSLSPQMAMASYAAPLNYDPSAVQPQFTTFDPYAQQAQYEALLQAEWARQQAEAAEQQQQYYALQFQAAQFQPTQLQASQPPPTSQKTTFGCVFPLNTFLLSAPH